MKLKKKILVTLFIFSVLFVAQNRLRSNFSSSELNNRSAEFFESAYQQGCIQNPHAIVPCEWYTNDAAMPPMFAGMIDGAYISGENIVVLAQLSYMYFNDTKTNNEVNQAFAYLWQNRQEILPQLRKAAKEKGIELSAEKGADIAEYEYGKLLFEVGSMFFGVGELSASVKNVKFVQQAFETIGKNTRLAKLASIKVKCKPCAKIFANRSKLRDEFLVHHLDETKRLLNYEWKASGKTWDEFIKDYDAHHVIPVNMLEESKLIQLYYENGGKLNFNSLDNGMILKKVALGGEHAYHPAYNRSVLVRLNEIELKAKILDSSIKMKFIEKEIVSLIEQLKITIFEKSVKKGKKINELFI